MSDSEETLESLSAAKDVAERERDEAVLNTRKLQIALAAGFPGDKAVAYASRLQGTTDDELVADAKQLAADLVTVPVSDPAFDPSQGQGLGSSSPTKRDDWFREGMEQVGLA